MRFRRLSWRGRLTYIATVMLISLALMGIGFAWWAAQVAEPLPEALAALESNDTVAVDYAVWLTFSPTAEEPTTGFIFYPGARVDPRAYAPAAQTIAEAGYLVIIVPMPLNLATFGVEQAAEVMMAFPQIERWAIGGHSVGGAMAAKFTANHLETIDVLVLWAAYPDANDSLAAASDLSVTVIYGTDDMVATPAEIEAAKPYLPTDTTYVPIPGGNHDQFAWSEPQSSDVPAPISLAAHQEAVIAATLTALQGNGL